MKIRGYNTQLRFIFAFLPNITLFSPHRLRGENAITTYPKSDSDSSSDSEEEQILLNMTDPATRKVCEWLADPREKSDVSKKCILRVLLILSGV